MIRSCPRFSLVALLAVGCAWEPPLDPLADQAGASILGSVLYLGGGEPTDSFVLLYDAADPPPPTGTGGPVNFAGVASENFSTSSGSPAASFALTGVPAGDWLVTGLMDRDGDFHPALSSNAGATCGDWMGAYVVDLKKAEVAVLQVESGERLEGITVITGSEVTTERPAFVVDGNTVSATSSDTQLFGLSSTAIASELVQLDGPYDGTSACQTMFYVWVVDEDADGVPDPHPDESLAAAGLYNIWPRIYLSFEGSADHALEEGESYLTEAPIYPDFLITGEASVGVPTPLTSLNALFLPVALHTASSGATSTVEGADVPAGDWSVTVVSFTGQTWTVPNETAAYPSTDPSFDPVSQGAGLLVE